LSATRASDEVLMELALDASRRVRTTTSPNPWVGCVIVATDGRRFEGVTEPPGGPHAEAGALRLAGEAASGSTAYVTLEPCAHHGRTPPCVDALIAAHVRRVVVGTLDPDSRVQGAGVDRLREAGIDVTVGVNEAAVREFLAPYLKHRKSGRPWVVVKLAATLDGKIAAPDGRSDWITGEAARLDVHRLRAESDAILVGAGTVRADNPRLTVRDVQGSDPIRIVLGSIPTEAAVLPALERVGELDPILVELGERGVLQLLVEGGAAVAHAFYAAGLVDRYVFYYAPAVFGGSDALGMFSGLGAPSMEQLLRGRIVRFEQLGQDLRVDFDPLPPDSAE
jgi:diaminohydroxyphosphoribosylaminopyrimidine deaminase / 5-amino-6-(5-phosphoribosylamino)uracil reductase